MDGRHTVMLPQGGEQPVIVEPADFDPGETNRKPPAVVVHTSGSTGAPKAVGLSAQALRTSAEATAQWLGGHGRWYLALSPAHIAGAQVLLRSQLAGTTPFVAEGRFCARSFAQDVRAIRQAELHSSAERLYTSLVPTQLVRIMRDPVAVAAAAHFDAILLGGAAVSPALLERAADAGLHIVRTYGMSETGGGCVYNGVPFDGVGVKILGESSGRIELSGPVLADGYVRFVPDVDGRPSLRALPDEGTGFSAIGDTRRFLTSDLGRLDDGVLSVLGRADDVIITGGHNVSPLAVENALLRVLEPYGVAEVLVTSVPDEEWGQRLVALVVASSGEFSSAGGADPQEMARRLRELSENSPLELQPHEFPRAVIATRSLPTKSIGKPDRAAAQLIAERALSSAAGED